MFTSARLKLTIWYTLIIIAISGTLSVLFYLRTATVLDQQFAFIQQRLMHERTQLGMTGRALIALQILPEEIASAKRDIVVQLLIINGVIVVAFAGAGYLLSGKTLRPIQQALDDQKRFVGDAAHELKTPLTALKISLEVSLMDKNLPQEARPILEDNLEDVNGLQSLTENLLQLARQDASQDPDSIPFATVAIHEVVDRAISQVRSLAEKKEVQIEVLGNIPDLTISGHRASLQHMLIVFLDNAIKYSPRGSKVAIEVIERKDRVQIKITDTGIGIAKHHLPHIFDRFYRVDSSRTRSRSETRGKGDVEGQEGGFGLGLSVAKKIIEQHSGLVTVESEVGRGTVFTVMIPLLKYFSS